MSNRRALTARLLFPDVKLNVSASNVCARVSVTISVLIIYFTSTNKDDKFDPLFPRNPDFEMLSNRKILLLTDK